MGWTTKYDGLSLGVATYFFLPQYIQNEARALSALYSMGNGHFPGGDTDYSPPRGRSSEHVELYLLCPICLTACTGRTLPTYTKPAFTQGHAASHPSDMACVGTKSTHQLHTSTAPRHASHGWKSSQTVNDPAMSGEANRSIYAGWRTKPWRTFILHVTWTNLWNSSHRNSVSRPHSVLSMYFTSLERGIKMKSMNSNIQSPNTSYSWGNHEE